MIREQTKIQSIQEVQIAYSTISKSDINMVQYYKKITQHSKN